MSKLHTFFWSSHSLLPMVIVRIVIGFSLFFAYLCRFNDVQFLWGPQGIAGNSDFGHFTIRYFYYHSYVDPFFSSSFLTWAAYFLILLVTLFFTLGLFTKSSGVLLFFLHIMFLTRNEFVFHGWAFMVLTPLLICIAADSGRRIGIDKYFRPLPIKDVAVSLRLMQLYLCILYICASWGRFPSKGWASGETTLTLMAGDLFGRLAFDPRSFPLFWQASQVLGLWVEALAPLALWIPWLGQVFLVLLLGLHLGIGILSLTGMWSLLMMGFLSTFISAKNLQTIDKYL